MNYLLGVFLVGNVLLLASLNGIELFSGPSTPEVVWNILLGFAGTNFLALLWMLLFCKIHKKKIALTGSAGVFVTVAIIIVYLRL